MAAKSGLNGFTKAAALELGPFGVTVNAVAPGLTVTAMTARSAARRVGYPEDIAHAVSFFTSEGAGYVTGQVLYVAGAPLG